jgi:hypothetical protein
MTVRCRVNGFDVESSFERALDQLPTITKRLAELGAEPASPVQKVDQAARRPEAKVEPVYQPDGTPCCPVHHKPLAERRYSLYCPSRDTGDQAANDKRYCALKFNQ